MIFIVHTHSDQHLLGVYAYRAGAPDGLDMRMCVRLKQVCGDLSLVVTLPGHRSHSETSLCVPQCVHSTLPTPKSPRIINLIQTHTDTHKKEW